MAIKPYCNWYEELLAKVESDMHNTCMERGKHCEDCGMLDLREVKDDE